MYKIGQGCDYDLGECVKWLQRAADLVDRYEIRKIGLCPEFGEGFAKNKAKAREWYWLGKESGDLRAILFGSAIDLTQRHIGSIANGLSLYE
jgi:TPR repeat protein